MKKRLTNNLLLKIVSVIAAVILWVVIINIDNPTDTFTISGIPVRVLNEKAAITDNNLTYDFPDGQTVSVEVTAKRTDRRKISAEDFQATIDMNEIYGATGSVAVNIEVVNNKNLIRSWTQITRSIRVDVEAMQTKEFEIQVIHGGELEESYTFSETSVSPHSVWVTAPESVMEIIDHAGIKVDVTGVTDSRRQTGTVKLYTDENSKNELDMSDSRISMNVTEAEVTLGVVKTNQISVDVRVTGQDEVAEGYKYITYTCEPQTIYVTGAKALIADFDKLSIEEDLTGAAGNVVKTYEIGEYLPKGLEVAEGQPTTIEVTYQVDKLAQKSFYIGRDQVELLGASDEFVYQLGEDDMVTVTLEGLEEDLDRVKNRDISVFLEVAGYTEPGTYSCKPVVELPEEYSSFYKSSVANVHLIVTSVKSETDPTGESSSSGSEGSTSAAAEE